MHTEPRFRVFFIYGRGKKTPNQPWDLVFPDAADGYPVPLEKVFKAFAYVDSRFDYDFLVRTNLSTFWVLESLLKHLDSLPSKLCYEGDGPLPPKGRKYYVSGTDTIVNRAMITSWLNNPPGPHALEYGAEDQAMGRYFHLTLGAPLRASNMHFMEHLVSNPELNAQIAHEISEAEALNQSHFRIKTQHGNRVFVDETIALSLLRHYYGKKIGILAQVTNSA